VPVIIFDVRSDVETMCPRNRAASFDKTRPQRMVLSAIRNRPRLIGDTTNLKLESYLEKYERLEELVATCPSCSC
jgi:hypothetical protein